VKNDVLTGFCTLQSLLACENFSQHEGQTTNKDQTAIDGVPHHGMSTGDAQYQIIAARPSITSDIVLGVRRLRVS